MSSLNKRNKSLRVDPDFAKDLDEVMSFREYQRLDKRRDLSPREITRMMRNTSAYKQMLSELKTKPRRTV